MDITRGGGYLNRNSKTVTFTGASTLGLAGSSTTWFTVTGEILVVAIIPFCTTGLDESGATAVITLGVTTLTSLFIGATNSVEIDTNEFWVSTTPTANGIALPAAMKDIVVTDNIVSACTVTNTNVGVMRVDLYWMPLSSDAAVS